MKTRREALTTALIGTAAIALPAEAIPVDAHLPAAAKSTTEIAAPFMPDWRKPPMPILADPPVSRDSRVYWIGPHDGNHDLHLMDAAGHFVLGHIAVEWSTGTPLYRVSCLERINDGTFYVGSHAPGIGHLRTYLRQDAAVQCLLDYACMTGPCTAWRQHPVKTDISQTVADNGSK